MKKPLFVATHPRACSTAFERVFMTCRDTLQCVHEPFGDAWYFGLERLSDRYEDDEKARKATGFAGSTYRTIFENMERESEEGKRLFIKDMAQYWFPLNGKPPSIAPSLVAYRRGVGTDGAPNGNGPVSSKPAAGEPVNPTVIPEELLGKFHFAFLIRHPRSSIPSYYRCTTPPLDRLTGFHDFRPEEAGYAELRQFFDYACQAGLIGPRKATAPGGGQGMNGSGNETHNANGANGIEKHDDVEICLIDADDLLDNPYGVIEAFCGSTGIHYSPDMLKWDSGAHQEYARSVFAKWPGFHEDALGSTELRPRAHKKAPKSDDQLFAEWTEKFGQDAAKVIRRTVEENVPHYEYLKQFALKV
jgi:hypothetical protein